MRSLVVSTYQRRHPSHDCKRVVSRGSVPWKLIGSRMSLREYAFLGLLRRQDRSSRGVPVWNSGAVELGLAAGAGVFLLPPAELRTRPGLYLRCDGLVSGLRGRTLPDR